MSVNVRGVVCWSLGGSDSGVGVSGFLVKLWCNGLEEDSIVTDSSGVYSTQHDTALGSAVFITIHHAGTCVYQSPIYHTYTDLVIDAWLNFTRVYGWKLEETGTRCSMLGAWGSAPNKVLIVGDDPPVWEWGDQE